MQRSDFRIIERQNNYGKSEFIPQIKTNKMVGGFFGLFGGTVQDVWGDLYIEVYSNYVNNQHRFQKMLFISGFKSNAEDTIQFYIYHKSRKTIEYRGEKIVPIVYYGNQQKHLIYYDPNHYYSRGTGTSGFVTYRNEKEFKETIDNRLDKGKILKVHD